MTFSGESRGIARNLPHNATALTADLAELHLLRNGAGHVWLRRGSALEA